MRRSIVILFLMLSAVIGQASAENGDQYWMAKIGASWLNKVDKPDYLQVANFTYGYGLTKAIAAEIDYQQSVGGGKYTNASTAETGAYSYKLASIGAAYRHVVYERLYFRGKIAAAYGEEQVTRSIMNKTETGELFNISGALALGVLVGDVIGSSFTLELEYIQQSSTFTSVLLGANVTF